MQDRNLVTSMQTGVELFDCAFVTVDKDDIGKLVNAKAVNSFYPLKKTTTTSELYTYKFPVAWNLVVGDVVVVPGAGALKTAQIVRKGTFRLNLDFKYKFGIQKLDFGPYLSALEHEEKLENLLTQAALMEAREDASSRVRALLTKYPDLYQEYQKLEAQ